MAGLVLTFWLGLTVHATATPRDDARPLLVQAAATLRTGDVRTARAQVLAAVRADPDWPLARALQGRIALGLLDGVAAEGELRRAIAIGYPLADARHLLAHALLLQGRAPAALAEARSRDVPARYRTYAARMAAGAQTALGDRAAAVRTFELAAATAPADSRVWSDLARLRATGGDVPGGEAAAARALQLDAINVDALILSANLVRDRYGYVAALPWYDRALAVEPGHRAAMLDRAATLGEAGRTTAMLAQTRAILAAAPGDPDALYLQAVLAARAGDWGLAQAIRYRIGQRLAGAAGMRLLTALIDLQRGALDSAIAQLRVLAEAQPGNVRVRRLLGLALWRSGDDRGAVELLRPLADRADADTQVLTIVGRAYERLGERVIAARALDRAALPVRTVPAGELSQLQAAASARFSQANAFALIAALRQRGSGVEAARVLDFYRAQVPGSVLAARVAADGALAAGDWRRAAALLMRVRRSGGERDAGLLADLAWARAGQRRPDEAVALARQAHGLLPANAAIASSLGWLLAQAGDRRQGRAFLAHAVAIAPDEPLFAR